MTLFGWDLPPGCSLNDIDALFNESDDTTLLDALTLSEVAVSGAQRVAWDAQMKMYHYTIGDTHCGYYYPEELANRVAGARERRWSETVRVDVVQ